MWEGTRKRSTKENTMVSTKVNTKENTMVSTKVNTKENNTMGSTRRDLWIRSRTRSMVMAMTRVRKRRRRTRRRRSMDMTIMVIAAAVTVIRSYMLRQFPPRKGKKLVHAFYFFSFDISGVRYDGSEEPESLFLLYDIIQIK
ncbi:hypothetical protein GmHk_17G049391 [Glycine max]|nr:hypothetical protein GmHk_17G049391 [Glycine max]